MEYVCFYAIKDNSTKTSMAGIYYIIIIIVFQLDRVRKVVAEMAGRNSKEVRVVVSPYRICPLGAHIDHQVSLVFFFPW